MNLLPLLLLAAFTCTALAERTVVYVANGGSKSISLFDLNPATGELKPRGEVELEGNPGPLALSPNREFIFAALRSNKSVQTLRVAADGGLTSTAIAPIDVNAAYLHVDGTGANLLTADYGGDTVTTHRISKEGVITVQPISKLATGRNPHSIQSDPTGRFAFAPLCGADKVLQFQFRPQTGELTPNTASEVAFQAGDGPRHFAFHPTKPVVYVVNEKSSSVQTLAYDGATGTMKPLQQLSTRLAGAEGKNSCADIHVSPDGKYVFASNRGDDSLARYSVDEKGTLTALGTTPTEKTPRAFMLDGAGRFVFVAGQGSHQLAVYRLNSGTGELVPAGVYPTGKGPAWVLAVTLEK